MRIKRRTVALACTATTALLLAAGSAAVANDGATANGLDQTTQVGTEAGGDSLEGDGSGPLNEINPFIETN